MSYSKWKSKSCTKEVENGHPHESIGHQNHVVDVQLDAATPREFWTPGLALLKGENSKCDLTSETEEPNQGLL